MIKFYANIRTPDGDIYDKEGSFALSPEGARADVVQGIREMVRDSARSGVVDLRGEVEITDADRQVLAVIRYTDAVRIITP